MLEENFLEGKGCLITGGASGFGRGMAFAYAKRGADIVLVDTGVIARAPTRFLVSGMGDALSTYFEARSCIRSGANNMSGGKSTKAAYAIAKTGTAAIAILGEKEESFFKAFLIVSLAEAIAIYGLIVALIILLF